MITIQAKALYKAMNAVKHTEVSHLPVANYAQLTLTDNGAVFASFTLTDEGKDVKKSEPVHYRANGERWETCVPLVHVVDVQYDGSYRFAGKRKFYPFLDYLRVMAEFGETLELSYDSSTEILTVKAGGSRSEFKCLNALEFPPC